MNNMLSPQRTWGVAGVMAGGWGAAAERGEGWGAEEGWGACRPQRGSGIRIECALPALLPAVGPPESWE